MTVMMLCVELLLSVFVSATLIGVPLMTLMFYQFQEIVLMIKRETVLMRLRDGKRHQVMMSV